LVCGFRVGRGYGGQKLFMNGRKGMSEFIGYTFKRESEPSVAEVITSPQSLIDPVNDKDLFDK